MKKAFILGAGLGNRLRPLTDHLPKPMVPLFHRPLAEWAMLACAREGISEFAINTHHLPDAWKNFGSPRSGDAPTGGNGLTADLQTWEGNELTLFHEPILLETGGGLKNIASWLGDDSVLIHNGDIFSTMPLGKLIAAHEASPFPVTLALRTEGLAKHIALDATGSIVTDIRNLLGRGDGTHIFSGIYCVDAEFLKLIPAGEKISVIPAFLELAKSGQLGAIVLDDGDWLDLGERESYLHAHWELNLGPAIHPQAVIEPGAIVKRSVIGAGAVVESGAVIRDSVVWPGGHIGGVSVIDRCIVFSQKPLRVQEHDCDL